MTKQEITSQIQVLEKQLNGSLPENIKKLIPAKIEKLKKQLEELESSEKKEDKSEDKSEKKRGKGRPKKEDSSESKKMIKPKGVKEIQKPKDTKKSSKKLTVKYHDKEYTEDDKEFCDILIKSMKERKEKMKKAAKRHKTVSISMAIGSKIADAVEKAIDNVDKNELKSKPKLFIAKFEKIEKTANEFINSFKSILGEDYDSEDIKTDLKSISDLIDKIKSKYLKK